LKFSFKEYQVVPMPTCDDQLKNQNELAIDCGGVCGSCDAKPELTMIVEQNRVDERKRDVLSSSSSSKPNLVFKVSLNSSDSPPPGYQYLDAEDVDVKYLIVNRHIHLISSLRKQVHISFELPEGFGLLPTPKAFKLRYVFQYDSSR
jgi:hypothetical protein